jgi:hypothetical protein
MLFTRSYPVPAEEVSRLAELKRYRVLDTDPERVFDDVVKLASSLFRTSSSVISLVDDDRQWFKARHGIDTCQTGRSEAFCAHTILSKDVMVVPNAREDPRFSTNPLVVGPPFINFYAGAPLSSPKGYNIGTLCIIDTAPRKTFGGQDRKHLKSLADIAIAELNKRIAEYNRRDGERLRSGLEGVLSSYGIRPTVIDVVNVSARGAMIQCRGLLVPKGEEIVLSIGKIVIVATVAWANEDMDGLTFHRDLSPAELATLTRQAKLRAE